MKTLLFLAILSVPALVHADVWRWRDARGQLHYSNVSEHVPPHATVVTGAIGTLASEVPSPDMKAIERDLEAYDKLHTAPVNLWLWQARWTLAWRELGVVN